MTIFFTADTHFNHANVINFESRPFASVEEMDEVLIENWNRAVTPNDEVWVLGDYSLPTGREKALSYLSKLHGTKYLVTGNHDRCSPAMRNAHLYQREYLDAGFAAIFDVMRLRLPALTKRGPKLDILMSHYPYSGEHGDAADRYTALRLRDTGVPLIHGHVHGEWRTRFSEAQTPMINVGVERWDYTPVSAQDLHRLFLHMSEATSPE